MSQYQLRIIYDDRDGEIFGPYEIIEKAEDVANQVEVLAHVKEIYIEIYTGEAN